MKLPVHIAYAYKRIADVDEQLAGSLLSENEHVYLEQVTHASRRQEYIAGRITARHFAAEFLQCRPEDVPLVVAEDGSLRLQNTAYSISLAHSHQGVCVAIAEGTDVGIDLEVIKPRHPDLYRFILHPEEYPLLDSLPLSRDSMLILFWALKEATLKGMKTGFRCSPKHLRLSIDLEHNQANVVVQENPGIQHAIWKAHFKKIDSSYLTIAHPTTQETLNFEP